jgi:hypothetical protein
MGKVRRKIKLSHVRLVSRSVGQGSSNNQLLDNFRDLSFTTVQINTFTALGSGLGSRIWGLSRVQSLSRVEGLGFEWSSEFGVCLGFRV